MNLFEKVNCLSQKLLLEGLKNRIQKERECQAELLAYLGEVERRRLYAVEGYSSMFRFVKEEFKLSEDSAIKRIQAARIAQRFP